MSVAEGGNDTVRKVLESGDVRSAADLLRTYPELAGSIARGLVGRMLHGSRPDFYGFQQFKSALVKTVGTDEAGALLAHASGTGIDRRATRLRLEGLQGYARRHGLLYEEILKPSTVYLPPPFTSGKVQLDGFEAQTRTFFRCVLKDVIVPSKSNFLLCADRALLDF